MRYYIFGDSVEFDTLQGLRTHYEAMSWKDKVKVLGRNLIKHDETKTTRIGYITFLRGKVKINRYK